MRMPRNSACASSAPEGARHRPQAWLVASADRKSTRLNSSHQIISYAVFCLKKKKKWRDARPIHKGANLNFVLQAATGPSIGHSKSLRAWAIHDHRDALCGLKLLPPTPDVIY